MTASPAPGMPSEEAIARIISPHNWVQVDLARTWKEHPGEDWERLITELSLLTARDILALIRPAFEAKEREIDTYRTCADANESDRRGAEQEIARLKAKLAQAVEALRPFVDALGHEYPEDAGRDDSWNIWEASEAMNITLGDLRRARAAAAMGEKT